MIRANRSSILNTKPYTKLNNSKLIVKGIRSHSQQLTKKFYTTSEIKSNDNNILNP
jgi:hypothetical protein